MRFRVAGMCCGDCARNLTAALDGLPDIERCLVDVATAEVSIVGTASESALRDRIATIGYSVLERLDGQA